MRKNVWIEVVVTCERLIERRQMIMDKRDELENHNLSDEFSRLRTEMSRNLWRV